MHGWRRTWSVGSYRRQTSQILTEKTKNLRQIKSVRLLNKLKHPKKPNMLWFFSDEKNFCQDQVHNSQNHCWIATNNRDVPGYGLWCGFKWVSHHATSHLRSWLKSQHQSVPRCAVEFGDPLVQLGGRCQTLGLGAGPCAGPQVQRDPGLASEGVLRLCTLLSLPPHPPTWTRRLVIRREHPQHDLPQHQS